ncbi:MAG: hypothetical protein LBG60_05175 [Bifidobacteriaceae bacterium]|nr:hypothetical protein [Bifidobacteriaceae bacterium]
MADLADWEGYFWPGTKALRNLFDEQGQDALNALESMAVKTRYAQAAADPVEGGFEPSSMPDASWSSTTRTRPCSLKPWPRWLIGV